MKNKEKRCRICGEPFIPHPQTAKIQKTCPKKACRRAADRQRYKRFRDLNPGYGRSSGRRAKVRIWAYAWPNYWQHYRDGNPDYVMQDNQRRALALRRSRRSAKQTAWQRAAVEKLRSIQALLPQDCSAKQTAWDPRVSGILDYLFTSAQGPCSAKQTPMENTAAAGG